MKLINYNYGYYNIFNCSIHGKIIVTLQEWNAMKKYLFNPAVKHCYLYKDILKQDLNRFITTKQGKIYNIRVTATKKIVNKFNITGYKPNNYIFLVAK